MNMCIFQVITRSELGGAQSVVINLANSLSKRHEVIVIAGEGNGKMWDLLDTNIKKEYIPYLKRALSPIDELRVIIAFKKLYLKYKPDIVHLHSSKAGILGRIAFPKSKIVYTVHGFDSVRVAHRKYLPVEKTLQNRCRAIVGVSKYDKNNLLKEGVKHQVSCIYNGIMEPFHLTNDPFNGIKGYKHKVLCVARLAAPKRFDLFLEIASLLPEYAFIWIGNQREVNRRHTSNVYFWGNIPNAGSYNEYADLFFLASDYEGLPIVIIEALACGKPVVASAVGGIPELLNGKNGFAVNNDSQEMANKINFILSNENLRQEMGCEARLTYLRNFTVDKMVSNYEKLYNQINC